MRAFIPLGHHGRRSNSVSLTAKPKFGKTERIFILIKQGSRYSSKFWVTSIYATHTHPDSYRNTNLNLMKKILFTLATIFCTLTLCAQSGAHSPSQGVMLTFFNTDANRCLTISYDDVVMWDYIQKKPIWTKKASEFGGFKNLGFPKAVTASDDLTYMIKENPEGTGVRAYLFDLNTFKKIGWGWDERYFAANGSIPVVQYMQGRNQNIAYIIKDPFSLEKEKLADNIYKVSLDSKNNNLLYIDQQEAKNGNPKRYKYYNIAEKKFIPVPPTPKWYYNTELKRWVTKGEEDLKYYKVELRNYPKGNQDEYTIICTDQDEKTVKTFTIANAAKAKANGYEVKPIIAQYLFEKNQIRVIEHKNLNGSPGLVLSFLNTYNYLTGEWLESLELTNANTNAIAAANTKNEKLNEARKKQAEINNEINNRPENILKQRVNALMWNGSYVINQQTLRIFKLQPEKGAYQNGMASLEAITTAGNSQAFEKIDNLENKALYKGIKGYKVCPYCQGKGAIKTEHVKEIDKTYSQGKIYTQTTTYTKGCQSCGGGGVIPN